MLFNSQRASPSGYKQLSNFYGGVEIQFTAEKFRTEGDGALVRAWLCRLPSLSRDQFTEVLMRLQPEKKWTERKKNYWFDSVDGMPIIGILAKLVSKIVNTLGNKRLEVVVHLATGKTRPPGCPRTEWCDAWRGANAMPPMDDTASTALMERLLRDKYAIPCYRSLLLQTGERALHEAPLCACHHGDWTWYKHKVTGEVHGGDRLGLLLVKLRTEIRASMRTTHDDDRASKRPRV